MPGCAVCRVAMTSEEENIRSSSFVRTQVRSPQKLWVRFTPMTNHFNFSHFRMDFQNSFMHLKTLQCSKFSNEKISLE